MRFKLQTDYALRALLYLSAHRGENCTTEEIAAYFQISAAHLGRVIRRLQAHGYVKAIRGRKGGVRLDREAGAITLGEVVESLEGQDAEGDANEHPMHCPERLEAVLRRAQGLFLNYLKQVDFAELGAEGLPAHEVVTASPEVSSDHPMPTHQVPAPALSGPAPMPTIR